MFVRKAFSFLLLLTSLTGCQNFMHAQKGPRERGQETQKPNSNDASKVPQPNTPQSPLPDTSQQGIIKPPFSSFITVDQFGYLPTSEKVAVIRNPQVGFNSAESFTPGNLYQVVDATTKAVVYSASPIPWNGGAIDSSSGDIAYWFDFSSVTKPGTYYIRDQVKNIASDQFDISIDVYKKVLEAAVRTFYYQRSGFEKKANFAGAGWADKASHVGPGQDKECHKYDTPTDDTTRRDLSGGWYDAGDYNKYTSWAAGYIINLLRAYEEAPQAFSDDTNIPESGNGIPDVLDEAKWGMDWLIRMQNDDGSVLSIVGVASASPPSAATGPSYYGDASTSATLNASAAFAYGAKVFGAQPSSALKDYGASLLTRATRAYSWADSHPNVIFRNNEGKSAGLGSGQQETDDYGRLIAKLAASCYLAETTKVKDYNTFFENNYQKTHLISWTYASPYEHNAQELLLYYANLPSATPAVKDKIRAAYLAAMHSSDNLEAFMANRDPYLAYIKEYTWGSNTVKATQGLMFFHLGRYELDAALKEDSKRAASRYLHYFHGVNPLALVYLSNMSSLGAVSSVTEFFHTWFADGSDKWDKVGKSAYGPPPGFLTGGPNHSYDWDGCCPSNCGSDDNNKKCTSESLEPPKGQPSQKSYKDFNTSWPLNSWAVSENSNTYQVMYIRLLAPFVATQ